MRKGMAQGLARTSALDRNPVQRVGGYTVSGLGPHTATVRFTFTCSAGKKLQIMSALSTVIRDAVAGTASFVTSAIQYLPAGINATNFILAPFIGNVIGAGQVVNIGQGMLMLAGDVIQGVTSDASTGGTMWYQLWYTGIEYDA